MFKHFTAILFISITLFFTSCEEDNPVADDGEHFEAAGYVIKKDGNIVFRVFKGQVDTGISSKFNLNLVDGEEHYDIEFLDEDGNDIGTPEHDHGEDNHDHGDDDHDDSEIDEEEETYLSIDIEDTNIVEIEIEEWEIHVMPLSAGETNFRVQIMHLGHADFTTPYVPLEVK